MSNYDRLAEPVRKWIWHQKWAKLRDVQEKAIPPVLAGGDVVISARTAAGKTEAAFLPLVSRVLGWSPEDRQGFDILYVSPLKALINDQSRRLESLCEACDLALHRWHGDVSAEQKRRARERPSGIVLITPESLEATLVRRGGDVRRLFGSLAGVVIDELHAFIGTERGMQLQSILNRIEVACGRDRIDRIGLSATLGDMRLAAEALRPRYGGSVTIVEGLDPGNGVQLQIRGYAINQADKITSQAMSDAGDAAPSDAAVPDDEAPRVPEAVAKDLFRLLRGKTNLLFAGSRDRVELYADTLREMCEADSLPNEFFPHHGNLARDVREDLELRLRDDPRPTTAVATTTLELGIDIGDVDSVAQIGPGMSVASLRQRLGRSGRRAGRPAAMRIFALEPALGDGVHPIDRLRLGLVQAIAMVRCLETGWCEPPAHGGLHLSTLVHQILAVICQTGGIKPATAWRLLCERGPFWTVDKDSFAHLLRAMASTEHRLIEQSPEGLLMVGAGGEKITEAHDFYAVFNTPDEYRIVHGTRTLGTRPIDGTVTAGQSLIFAGRRWLIQKIDDEARVIEVKPSKTGKPPAFRSEWGGVHDHIVDTMRSVLAGADVPAWLDRGAAALLEEARVAWSDFDLANRSVLAIGSDVVLFPWVGTRKLATFALALLAEGFVASPEGVTIRVAHCSPDAITSRLKAIANAPPPDPDRLVERVAKPYREKFDPVLTKDLLGLVTLAERLEIDSIPLVAAKITAHAAV